MMKAAPSTQRKSSKKVQALLEGSFTIKTLWPLEKKRDLTKKLREFHSKTYKTSSRAISPSRLDDSQDLDTIGLVPTIELTHEQLENLIGTAEALAEKFASFGAVKLKLPKGIHVQKLDLEKTKKKLTVRQQVLPALPRGKVRSFDKAFVNFKETYTFKEFKELADETEAQYQFVTPAIHDDVHRYLREEREFWGIVHGKIGRGDLIKKKSMQKTKTVILSNTPQTSLSTPTSR
jgi:hypothetical protein